VLMPLCSPSGIDLMELCCSTTAYAVNEINLLSL
jgi:hypothetical protein